jgi:hypothetical protein
MLEEKLWSSGVGTATSAVTSKADKAVAKRIAIALSDMSDARRLMRSIDSRLSEVQAARSAAQPSPAAIEEAHLIAIDFAKITLQQRAKRKSGGILRR